MTRTLRAWARACAPYVLPPLLLLVLVTRALAGDSSPQIDLTPLLQIVVAAAVPTVSVLASSALIYLQRLLKARTGIALDAAARETIDHGLQMAIAYGAQVVHDDVGALGSSGALAIHVRNAKVAAAVGYALERIPDALARFGIDSEAVARMIAARLAPAPVAPVAPAAPVPAAAGA